MLRLFCFLNPDKLSPTADWAQGLFQKIVQKIIDRNLEFVKILPVVFHFRFFHNYSGNPFRIRGGSAVVIQPPLARGKISQHPCLKRICTMQIKLPPQFKKQTTPSGYPAPLIKNISPARSCIADKCVLKNHHLPKGCALPCELNKSLSTQVLAPASGTNIFDSLG